MSANLKFLSETLRCLLFRKNNRGGNGALFIRPDNIGDFVLWAPFAEAEIERLHDQKIKAILLCKPSVAELARKLLSIDEIIEIDVKEYLNSPAELLKQISKSNFDMLFAPRASREFKIDDLIALAANAPISSALNCSTCLVNPLIQKVSSHWYKKIIHPDYAGELSAAACFHALPPSPAVTQRLKALPALSNMPENYFAVFPGAADIYRCADVSIFADAINAVTEKHPDIIPVICGTENEKHLSDALVNQLDCEVLDLTGQTSLTDAAAITAHSKLVIGNESAAIHLAALANVPAVCAAGFGHWGRFVPYSNNYSSHLTPPVTVTADGEWDCKNCNWNCTHKREYQTVPCIKEIKSEKFTEAVLRAME